MIEWWIDIPNLQTVDLPNSFQSVKSKSITRICMNMNEWIDVSPLLANLIPFSLFDIESLDTTITSITIPDHSVNNTEYTIFNFSRFTLLEELIIGDDCFSNVNIFKIDGLNHLKSLAIGCKSFTQQKDNWNALKNSDSQSFAILNCDELKSINIGRYSFSGCGGLFELKNLPKLETIIIGSIETDRSESNNNGWSFNFFGSSFEIKGNIDGYC